MFRSAESVKTGAAPKRRRVVRRFALALAVAGFFLAFVWAIATGGSLFEFYRAIDYCSRCGSVQEYGTVLVFNRSIWTEITSDPRPASEWLPQANCPHKWLPVMVHQISASRNNRSFLQVTWTDRRAQAEFTRNPLFLSTLGSISKSPADTAGLYGEFLRNALSTNRDMAMRAQELIANEDTNSLRKWMQSMSDAVPSKMP